MNKGFLIDLDGVAYLGERVIPTCRDFIKKCNDKGIKFCFVTNNSSRTTDTIYEHLISLGYELTKENIITSSEVTANYIVKEKPNARVYLIGMNGIREELEKNNLQIVEKDADYVVIGIDFEINYAKYTKALREILNGAKFISTNSDHRLSKADGVAPGNGALTKVLEFSSGIEALYMGKPQQEMFIYGLKKLNLPKEQVMMIGDNYYTDILGAHNFGMESIFVETGVMTIKEIEHFPIKPTIIVKNLLELDI